MKRFVYLAIAAVLMIGLLPSVAAQDVVPITLWVQSPGVGETNASDSDSGFSLADDFVLSLGSVTIQQVDIWGRHTGIPEPATSTFTLRLWHDVDGLPGGDVIYEQSITANSQLDIGSGMYLYSLPLTTPQTLEAGTYWVEFFDTDTNSETETAFTVAAGRSQREGSAQQTLATQTWAAYSEFNPAFRLIGLAPAPYAPNATAMVLGWPPEFGPGYFEVPFQAVGATSPTIMNIVQTNTRTQGVVSADTARCHFGECYAAFNYVPPATHPAAMSFTFTYQVNDGNSDSNIATVTLLVGDIPVALDDDFLATEDPVTTTLPLEGGHLGEVELTFNILTQPLHGEISGLSDPACTFKDVFTGVSMVTVSECTSTGVYTPAPLYTGGRDSFTFQVCDAVLCSAPGTIDLWVGPNSTPTAEAYSIPASSSSPVYLELSATDPDVIDLSRDDRYSDNLTFVIDTPPGKGTLGPLGEPDCYTSGSGPLTQYCSSLVLYTPNAGLTVNTTDSFTYHVSDGHTDSRPATVDLTLNVPTTWLVTTNADELDAACDAADCSLREAITYSMPYDLIDFALPPSPSNTITLVSALGPLLIDKYLTIIGPGAGQLTISGSGVLGNYNDGGVFTIRDNGQPKIVNISGLKIQDGHSYYGGGINYAGDSDLNLSDCVIGPNNIVTEAGGGIAINGGNVTLNRCTVYGNSGTGSIGGAGIYISEDASVRLINSTVSGNVTNNFGGGIYVQYSTVILQHSTITNNQANQDYATEAPGGVGGIYANEGLVRIQNSIVAANVDLTDPATAYHPKWPDVYGPVLSRGGNLIGDGMDTTGWTASDLVGTAKAPINPKLDALTWYDSGTFIHALLQGSPAIDAAACMPEVTIDQRNVDRPKGSACDCGAYELWQTMAVDDIDLTFKPGTTIITGKVSISGIFGPLSKAAVQVAWKTGGSAIPGLKSSPTVSTDRNGIAKFILRGQPAGTYQLCVTAVTKTGWDLLPDPFTEYCKELIVPVP